MSKYQLLFSKCGILNKHELLLQLEYIIAEIDVSANIKTKYNVNICLDGILLMEGIFIIEHLLKCLNGLIDRITNYMKNSYNITILIYKY